MASEVSKEVAEANEQLANMANRFLVESTDPIKSQLTMSLTKKQELEKLTIVDVVSNLVYERAKGMIETRARLDRYKGATNLKEILEDMKGKVREYVEKLHSEQVAPKRKPSST